MPPHTLLVIPCYRESARLPGFLPALCEALETARVSAEIQVVDDGSGPAEADALDSHVESVRPRFPFVLPLHRLQRNKGKGGAVYTGWNLAREHACVAFVDADGAVPPHEVVRLLAFAAQPAQIGQAVYAVRVLGAGRSVRRTFLRHLSGQVFRLCVRLFFDLGVPDTQCGFKILPTAAYRAIRGNLLEQRFCFDVELTCYLRRAGVEILSKPIDWHESPGTRVKPATARDMFFSLLRLRRRLETA